MKTSKIIKELTGLDINIEDIYEIELKGKYVEHKITYIVIARVPLINQWNEDLVVFENLDFYKSKKVFNDLKAEFENEHQNTKEIA